MRVKMTGWLLGYVMINTAGGVMGVATLLAAIALVVIDHALEESFAQH